MHSMHRPEGETPPRWTERTFSASARSTVGCSVAVCSGELSVACLAVFAVEQSRAIAGVIHSGYVIVLHCWFWRLLSVACK